MGKWTFLKKGDFLVRKIPRGPKWEPSEEVRRVLEAERRQVIEEYERRRARRLAGLPPEPDAS